MNLFASLHSALITNMNGDVQVYMPEKKLVYFISVLHGVLSGRDRVAFDLYSFVPLHSGPTANKNGVGHVYIQ